MEMIKGIILIIGLVCWALVSIGFLLFSIQNLRDDRRREKREREKELRDIEYHNERMKQLKK